MSTLVMSSEMLEEADVEQLAVLRKQLSAACEKESFRIVKAKRCAG
ncbi:MAG TPA: hypothetical protein VGF97_06585 [Rhizomicrobium sp.]|jgi:hypothetical protein